MIEGSGSASAGEGAKALPVPPPGGFGEQVQAAQEAAAPVKTVYAAGSRGAWGSELLPAWFCRRAFRCFGRPLGLSGRDL